VLEGYLFCGYQGCLARKANHGIFGMCQAL
jgi:hypothetical protein